MVTSDPARTRERIGNLTAYFAEQGIVGDEFRCRHFQQCRASRADLHFFEGQTHHVGDHYDLTVSGTPLRIVVVGQEYGHPPAMVDREARAAMVRSSAAHSFRSRGRNPHMKGTATTLRLLLGRDPGDDRAGEMLDLPGGAHLFDAFALVNFLLCTAADRVVPTGEGFAGAARGRSSSTMQRSCAPHFLRALEILDPTVIVVQGRGRAGVRGWMERGLDWPRTDAVTEEVTLNGRTVPMLTTYHPSARDSQVWGGSLASPYLRDTVVPAVGTLRARLGLS